MITKFKLARPGEIPFLRMAGYEVLTEWDGSFVLLRSRHNPLPHDPAAEKLADDVAELSAELVGALSDELAGAG